MTDIDLKGEDAQPGPQKELILSVTLDDEVIQFNQECERVTEFPRDDILHKRFSETLLPSEFQPQWKSLLQAIQQTMKVDGFVLPLKTRHDSLCEIQWNGFLVKDENGRVQNICLLGTLVHESDGRSSEQDYQNQQFQPAQKPDVGDKVSADHSIQRPMNEQQSEENLDEQRSFAEHALEKEEVETSDRSQKRDLHAQRRAKLEKRRADLEKRKDARRQKKSLKNKEREIKKSQKTSEQVQRHSEKKASKKPKSSLFSDSFGFKKNQQDFSLKMKQLEDRQLELEAFEARLLDERKAFTGQVNEFRVWREKLEQLEIEIEKRRQELLKQDVIPPLEIHQSAETMVSTPMTDQNSLVSETPGYPQPLDKIPQSAVVLQRGILKQINQSFADMIGYPMQEIVEKNFFDFIAVEGLESIEQYYLHRLKGENVTIYKTVFSTKQNEKLYVEVTIKPTIYKGEKAEIAIITSVENLEGLDSEKEKRG